MTMKVKAIEKKLKFTKNPNDPGVYRYVMQPEQYSSLSQKKVIKEAALRSGVSQGVMQACWDAAGEVIKAKTSLITTRRIIFTPDVDLKDELKNTAVQITCFDRDGKEVKRVTSADDGTIEDNENGGTTDLGNNGSTENGGTQNGGGNSGVGDTPGGNGGDDED